MNKEKSYSIESLNSLSSIDSRSHSVDSRSHSFDSRSQSFDSSTYTLSHNDTLEDNFMKKKKKDEKKISIAIKKKRVRDQEIEVISKSPSIESFLKIINNNNIKNINFFPNKIKK